MRFLRTSWRQKSKLGKGRIKKQKWRKARGRHNKIREKRKGRARQVEIGYRTRTEERGRIEGKIPLFIKNLKEAENVKKGDIVIIARIGMRKRLEIEKMIEQKSAKVLNLRGAQ